MYHRSKISIGFNRVRNREGTPYVARRMRFGAELVRGLKKRLTHALVEIKGKTVKVHLNGYKTGWRIVKWKRKGFTTSMTINCSAPLEKVKKCPFQTSEYTIIPGEGDRATVEFKVK